MNIPDLCMWWVTAHLACASSRLWSVMVMICCKMSPMSCFLPSPSLAPVLSWMCWDRPGCPLIPTAAWACIRRGCSSMSARSGPPVALRSETPLILSCTPPELSHSQPEPLPAFKPQNSPVCVFVRARVCVIKQVPREERSASYTRALFHCFIPLLLLHCSTLGAQRPCDALGHAHYSWLDAGTVYPRPRMSLSARQSLGRGDETRERASCPLRGRYSCLFAAHVFFVNISDSTHVWPFLW